MISFPANPGNGDIFELAPGLVYQYDASINSWVAIVSSDIILPVATTIKPGAMSAADYKKLNRLVLPPPFSTLSAPGCVTAFQTGALTLSGDDFVTVAGNLDLHGVDSLGDAAVEQFPFHIHQHTYGFDFKVDIENLITELESRDQFNIRGAAGEQGAAGERGEEGESNVATGPRGALGSPGIAPPCPYAAEVEPLAVELKSGVRQALVDARVVVDPDDDTKFTLQFDRQTIGLADASAYKFNVRQQDSAWVLAVRSAAGTQPLYHINLAPIIAAVREKYLSELQRLKAGYEDVTQFWVQTMSDLFDEQKSALCCALEFCQSKTKNTQLRQHLELTAATIAGVGKIVINERGSAEAQSSSGSGMLDDLPSGSDLCASAASAAQQLKAQKFNVFEPVTVVLDPLTHVRPENGVKLDLAAGEYTVTVVDMSVQINKKHFMPVGIQYQTPDKPKSVKFLNKGHFDSLVDAKKAYDGLTVSFTHMGGQVALSFNMFPTQKVSGSLTLSVSGTPSSVSIQPVRETVIPQRISCTMSKAKLEWYLRGWEAGRCCGCVINVGGQDYMVMKRSIGLDESCGGGENVDAPCIAELVGIGHPAIAWPTLDGVNPVPITDEIITFLYDQAINATAAELISTHNYKRPNGAQATPRHLTTNLNLILFPHAD